MVYLSLYHFYTIDLNHENRYKIKYDDAKIKQKLITSKKKSRKINTCYQLFSERKKGQAHHESAHSTEKITFIIIIDSKTYA